MAQRPVSTGQAQVTQGSLSKLGVSMTQCAHVSLFGHKFLSLFSVSLIVLTLVHNTTQRDCHEYIQKQVRDERIVIEGGLICFTLVASHATPTYLEKFYTHSCRSNLHCVLAMASTKIAASQVSRCVVCPLF